MRYRVVNLGFSSADAEGVRLQFEHGQLLLSFLDWQKRRIDVVFHEVLGFQCVDGFAEEIGIRDDTTYEVLDSVWLKRQAELSQENLADFVHYMLSFNSVGVLEVLAKRDQIDTRSLGS